MDISVLSVLGAILNFAILFFLFKKFLTKPISEAIEDRRSLIKKLENADAAYEQKIEEAKYQAEDILQEGLKRKESLIAEAGVLANKRREEILEEARNKAESIVEEAQNKSQNLENELKNNFSNGVKRTSLLVLKKLFSKDKDLKTEYLDEVVEDMVN